MRYAKLKDRVQEYAEQLGVKIEYRGNHLYLIEETRVKDYDHLRKALYERIQRRKRLEINKR